MFGTTYPTNTRTCEKVSTPPQGGFLTLGDRRFDRGNLFGDFLSGLRFYVFEKKVFKILRTGTPPFFLYTPLQEPGHV